jgi:hypothetical protein
MSFLVRVLRRADQEVDAILHSSPRSGRLQKVREGGIEPTKQHSKDSPKQRTHFPSHPKTITWTMKSVRFFSGRGRAKRTVGYSLLSAPRFDCST